MIIFLYGKDTLRSQKHLKEVVEKFKKDRDPQGLNTKILDSQKEVNKILENILASPFLSERRMVVIKNFLTCKDIDLQNDIIGRIKEKSFPETSVIVFWEGTDSFKTKESKKLFELLSKEKFSQKFDILKGVMLGSWISSAVRERGGKINPQATEYIMAHSGADMWQINSLVDQLISYCEEEISVADVQLFLDEKADDNIFNLVDAIIGKQEKQVYKMIREQYHKGEDVQFIFLMILRQVRILLELRDLFEKEDKISSDSLAKKLGLHPYVIKKSLPMIRHYNMGQLRSVYKQILNLDIQIKSSQGSRELLLDLFVARVCQ